MTNVIYSCAATIWRRLPVGPRRYAFRNVINALGPSLPVTSADIKVDRSLPKIIAGMLSSPSGLGQSARLAAAAFREQGFTVLGIDLSNFFIEPLGRFPCDLANGQGYRGAAHVVAVINAPYMKYVLGLLGREFLRDKFVTGYWAWELPSVPKTWEPGFCAVHEVMTPSSFAAAAIATRGRAVRIGVAAHPVVLDSPACLARTPREKKPAPFTIVSVMNVGSGFARKNPLALIRAFRGAFGRSKDARLKLIVTGTDNYPQGRALIVDAIGDSNVAVVWSPLDRGEFYRWWDDADVFALLHRSEGFGLPIAEAMCAGLPVVATGWSGNMDYMTEKTAFPVRYRLVEVEDPQGVYQPTEGLWADPDWEHAAEILLRLKQDRTLALAVGAAARRSVMEKFSSSAFVRPMIGT